MSMYNPPHPGEVLLGLHIEPMGMTITDFAKALDVQRKAISEIVNGRRNISPEMAMRLSKALNTTPDLWLGMQKDYDLWTTKQSFDDSRVKRLVA